MSSLKARLAVITLGIAFSLAFSSAGGAGPGGEGKVLWFFWGDGCEMCEEAMLWVKELERTYIGLEVQSREVWFDQEAQDLYLAMLEEREEKASWVPGFILGGEVWHGFNESLTEEIQLRLDRQASAQEDKGLISAKEGLNSPKRVSSLISPNRVLAATFLLATVDGFNPCSLWVLAVLLAMILNTRSRFRIAAVGGVFLLVTSLVYGLFIAGVFGAMAIVSYLDSLRWVIALLALGLAAINLRDYLSEGQEPVLGINSRWKGVIVKNSRKLGKERPLIITLFLTALFAAGVALIELPCTAGFPVIWTGILREAGIGGINFFGLLGLYLAAYLLIEALVVIVVLITLQYFRIQEIFGRRLKLGGGMLIGALGLMFLINPGAMESLTGLLLVFAGAAGVSLVIIAIQSRCSGASNT